MKRLVSMMLVLTMILSLFNVVPIQAAQFDETAYTLTGVQVDDIVEIAKTQVGYCEGDSQDQLDGTVSGSKNYTKYAKELESYGASNPNAWCAYFISWCAMKAGCLKSAVYFFTGVKSCVAKSKPYKANGLGTYHAIKKHTFTKGSVFSKDYTPSLIENYKPKKGDIMIFKTHVGLVVSDYNSKTDSFSIVEGNWGGKVNSRTVKMSNSDLVGFVSPDYNTTVIPTHTHSYSYSNDSTHPHSEYKYCSCGHKEYTGNKKLISSCTRCVPVGSLSLKRSVEKSKGNATFYRNNVTNANSYTLQVCYADGTVYGEYEMNQDTYTVRGIPSGEYYAVLYAKNNSTGEQRSTSCDYFKIIENYDVVFNANGGTGAPSNQTKYEDTPLTLTSSVPTKAHYVFKGWARSKNATVAEYQPGDAYNRNANTTLYAVWEPENYTIKFDANGGRGEISDTTITYGDAIRIPNDVICDYSYLKGWSTSKNATSATYKIGMDYKFDKNTTLYAVWGTSTWSGGASASLSGSGTEDDPYLIQSESDLGCLANKVNSQTTAPKYEYYKLTNNINLAYNEWVPIGLYGNEYQYFYGSFDGNGFTISDLYITQENEKNVGLFGYAKDSEIKNLSVNGAIEIVSSSDDIKIGAIVGYAEKTNIENITVKYFNIGGISVGTSEYSLIGTVAGKTSSGEIKDCKSYDSNITLKFGKFKVGMIAGESSSLISDCTVESTEEGLFGTSSNVGSFIAGGLCGVLSGSAQRCSVKAPYYSNNIKTTSESIVGGFVGELDGAVKVCSVQFVDADKDSITSTGTGSVYVGGFAGKTTANSKITDCKFDGNSVNSTTTSGSTSVGGLVGSAEAKTNPTVSVNGGQSLSKADLPTKEGYKATWYTDAEMTVPYDFTKTVTSDMTLYAKWEKGDDTPDIWDGTSSEPAYNASTKTYTITNGEELAWVSDVTNGVITSGTNFPTDRTFSGYTIELANDINLAGRYWTAIGNTSYAFAGTFDGKNYGVYGLYRSSAGTCECFGLIGCATGNIKNIKIYNAYIDVYKGYDTGFVLGKGDGATIENCHIINSYLNYGYSSYSRVGGVVGRLNAGKVSHCSTDEKTSIEGDCTYAGGIAGDISNSTSIQFCYNKATINAHITVGGIVGYNGKGCRVEGCYNMGTISAYNSVGGITGYNDGRISECYNRGNIAVDSYYDSYNAGGIAGVCSGSIYYTYNTTYVYCYSLSGAIVGNVASSNASLYFCYGEYSPLYAKGLSNVYPDTTYVQAMTSSQLKASLLTGFYSSYWAINSNINNGYPYLKSLSETYKTCKITTVVDADGSAINRSFANINGNLTGSGSGNANVGGIMGSANGSSGANSVAQNVIAIADGVTSSHNAGNIVGYNSGLFAFNNAYYNTDLILSSSTNSLEETYGTPKIRKSMNPTFYTNVMGLTSYTSLANLESDEKAVWVLENGKLPELYYNCLNDITISQDIENGSVTIDKSQAVDGEIVTVTATPNDGYVLNKMYVDGIEQAGSSFIVDGNDEIYVTFAPKIAEYDVKLSANSNATGTLENVDSAEPALMSVQLMSAESDANIKAKDGEEIKVNTTANKDYAIETIYVNGEEIAGDSFILTKDSEVTLDVLSISTDITATTYDAENVGCYHAVVSGEVYGADEGIGRYVRYWSEKEPDKIFTTTFESGCGKYTAELEDLNPETKYYYQMTEYGEIKSFTTYEETVDDEVDVEDGEYGESESQPITTTTYKTLTSTYKFSIECSKSLTTEFLMIACYDKDGKLLAIKEVECDGDTSYTGSVPIDTNIDYAKIFVWENKIKLIPVSTEEIVYFTN